MDIAGRLKEERKRLKLSQSDFGALGSAGKTTVISWERGDATPNSAFLQAVALAGADVRYIITGRRQEEGIKESAVHQAVLDAVDLLSLGNKVDAQQLAGAVIKLINRSPPSSSPSMNQQSVIGGNAQQFNAPISGGVSGRDLIRKLKGKSE